MYIMYDMSVGDEHTQTVSASATSATEQEADPEPPLGLSNILTQQFVTH